MWFVSPFTGNSLASLTSLTFVCLWRHKVGTVIKRQPVESDSWWHKFNDVWSWTELWPVSDILAVGVDNLTSTMCLAGSALWFNQTDDSIEVYIREDRPAAFPWEKSSKHFWVRKVNWDEFDPYLQPSYLGQVSKEEGGRWNPETLYPWQNFLQSFPINQNIEAL